MAKICTICNQNEAVGQVMNIMHSRPGVAPEVVVIAEPCNSCTVKIMSKEVVVPSVSGAMTFDEIITQVYNPEIEH